MRSSIAYLAAITLLTPVAAAQSSLIVSPDVKFIFVGNKAPKALGDVDDQESIITTPDAGNPYEARPFRTFTTINVMQGDGDNNGTLADPDRYGDCNCLFVRHRPPHAETGPFNPGNVWMAHSFNSTARVATTAGIVQVLDADVYRSRHGQVEFFVRESTLLAAMPGPPVGGNFDIDGMVQDAQGNLYFSTWDRTETFGGLIVQDADILYIDASDITYDARGFVSSITPNSVKVFATESDMSALVANSGALDTSGSPINVIFDVGAIDLDPNGGTWQSPANPNLTGANLIFASNTTTHLDNIWSTANGGSLAIINGVTMGYLTKAADGSVLGIGITASQDAINALIVVPSQNEWIALDSPNAGRAVQGVFDIEFGRVQPSSPFTLFLSEWPGQMPGGWVSGLRFPPGFLGGNQFYELSFTPVVVGTFVADAAGYGLVSLPDPGTVPPGVDVLLQGVGIPFQGLPFAASATSSLSF